MAEAYPEALALALYSMLESVQPTNTQPGVGRRSILIGATIIAERPLDGNAGVGGDKLLHEQVETKVGVVHDQTELVVGRVSGHVLVQHGLYVCPCRRVRAHDVAGTEETTLLTGVPVELDGVCGRELGCSKDAQGFENGEL